MKWRFHAEAAQEYLDACRRYVGISPELATAFTECMETAIDGIVSHPRAWPVVEEDVCRHLLKRFPYGVYYTIEADLILVVAVVHMRRKPGYWKHRL
ncbi:MAG: type II toxin-antitoxin system RelE/ParE family toxin [Candidatus Sumerlaeota bacterium]|nr:type II toxin-antitoxin system RelE/ParE family toxin [Candidatus Sumerlaeota bacterium]